MKIIAEIKPIPMTSTNTDEQQCDLIITGRGTKDECEKVSKWLFKENNNQKVREHIDSVLPDDKCEWIRQKHQEGEFEVFLTNCGEKELWEELGDGSRVEKIDKFCRHCGKKTKLSCT